MPRTLGLFGRGSNAQIDEAVPSHVLGTIDFAEIDHDRRRHHLAEKVEVERTELLPFVTMTRASASSAHSYGPSA